MIVNILVLAVIGLTAYICLQRAFSASAPRVHGGRGRATAPVWRPLVYGVLLGLREDIAWGVGLVVP